MATKEQLKHAIDTLNSYTKGKYDVHSGGNGRYYLSDEQGGSEFSFHLPKTPLYDCIYALNRVFANEKRLSENKE